MKKILILIVIALSSMFLSIELNALEGYTNDSYILVRTEPTKYSTDVAELPKYEILNIVDETLYNQNDPVCPTGWYKINYNGNHRYICGDYVTIGSLGDINPSYNDETFEARINDTLVSIRTSPSYSASFITYLAPGTNVVILEDNIRTNESRCNNWAKIQYHKNKTAYVCRKYISKKDELTSTNSEYEEYLSSIGFPNSYIPYLVKLHELHPTWIFNPVKTGLNWDYAVSRETGDAISETYLTSDIWDVYSVGYHEPGWQTASSGVTAFYMDPRNFLTEKFIFMYESLSYNYTGNPIGGTLDLESEIAKRYNNIITNMLGNSFLNTDEYKYMFLNAGYTYNVNPVHLVSRSIQEGASSETYAPVSGTVTDTFNGYSVHGYYNFYNIGAWGDNPALRGIAYACGSKCGFDDSYLRPWDTREKAIYGGAYFIADGYIDAGQDTLYFQKFNVKPGAYYPSFTHRYQTNVTAPCSEGLEVYESLVAHNLMDYDYSFDIPVFIEMPESTSLPQVASKINTLSEITVDGKLITGYDKDVVEYGVYVAGKDGIATINAKKDDSKSKVSGLGTVTLTGTETEHKIIVTAENGFTKTYKIKLIKVENDNTTLEDILSNLSVKVTDDLMNHISPNTSVLSLEQSISKQSVLTKVEIFDINGNLVQSNGLLGTGQKVKITTPSGEVGTYVLAVTGDTNGDGKVTLQDLLQVQKHIINTTLLNGAAFNAGDITGDGKVALQDLLKIQKHIIGVEKL